MPAPWSARCSNAEHALRRRRGIVSSTKIQAELVESAGTFGIGQTRHATRCSSVILGELSGRHQRCVIYADMRAAFIEAIKADLRTIVVFADDIVRCIRLDPGIRRAIGVTEVKIPGGVTPVAIARAADATAGAYINTHMFVATLPVPEHARQIQGGRSGGDIAVVMS